MKIAVIGGGGREHAIIRKLKESPLCGEITAIPGNGGIAGEVDCCPLKPTDIEAITTYCVENQFAYVIVTPDNPLALGLVDALAAHGIPAFGPTAEAARIESSKIFAKDLMQKYGIPTARYSSFDDCGAALDYIARQPYPLVIKADGLALGKGVVICQNEDEAVAALNSMMRGGRFGASGNRVVVEEFLTGPEVSVLTFCDGETVVPMVSAMDHKRALDGDKGENTGGMGAVAPNPFYTPEIADQCMKSIFLPTIRAMAAEGAPFRGCLYFGLMLTPGGPRVIEYNCRFGDPETQVILPLLESDLLTIMMSCTNGNLTPDMVRFSDQYAACVVLASGGYPAACQAGFPIAGIADAERLPGILVYQAGTKLNSHGQLVTAGGRVLGVTATGGTLAQALERAYHAAAKIEFQNMHCRRDIGGQALEACKDGEMKYG